MPRIDLIGLDGDDTLWHSERYFVVTQERVAALLAAHIGSEDFGHRLLAAEKANLELFGYGVKGFLLSLIETAIEVTAGRVGASEVQQIIAWGKEMLAHPVDLLDGVATTVAELARDHALVLITKGDLFHQEAKVAGSGLAEHFRGIEIVSEKDPNDYRRILTRYGVDPAAFVMVGNSLRSDVVPAVEIGGHGVYVPYHVTWGLEHAELPEALADRVRHISQLDQLPAVLEALEADRAAPAPPRPRPGGDGLAGRPRAQGH
jgi:putative hydrolase of the HAD superfamily